jgi:hypothetical protein
MLFAYCVEEFSDLERKPFEGVISAADNDGLLQTWLL